MNTVTVIDAVLKVTTPRGPAWHRYNGDGYGEHEDGSPFDGTGIGRAWPLLTGERAHYELAAGRIGVATDLAKALEAFAGNSGLLPEQIWDAADIPERELIRGEASGSARPRVWAHAEYLKLRRSLQENQVSTSLVRPLPAMPRARRRPRRSRSGVSTTRFDDAGRQDSSLRVARPVMVHWGIDGWHDVQDVLPLTRAGRLRGRPRHEGAAGSSVSISRSTGFGRSDGKAQTFTCASTDPRRWHKSTHQRISLTACGD